MIKLQIIIVIFCYGYCNAKLALHEIPSGRIIGGVPRNIADIPFQVSLTNGTHHFCGGALMSNEWIITAAHCLGKHKNIYARINSSDCTTGGLVVKVLEEHIHPDYDEYSYDYDVGLLKLKPIKSKAMKFVRFPKLGANPCSESDVVEVSGWGVNNIEDPEKKNILQSVRLEIVEERKCYDYFKKNFDVTERMMCAGVEEGGKDACQGDSGGPVTCKGDLIAVVSSGFACAKAHTPGLYSNIFHEEIKDWIEETSGIEMIYKSTSSTTKPPAIATAITPTKTPAKVNTIDKNHLNNLLNKLKMKKLRI